MWAAATWPGTGCHPNRGDYIARAAASQEGWPSGLRRSLGKRVYGKPYRGFESHPLRQYHSSPSSAILRCGTKNHEVMGVSVTDTCSPTFAAIRPQPHLARV